MKIFFFFEPGREELLFFLKFQFWRLKKNISLGYENKQYKYYTDVSKVTLYVFGCWAGADPGGSRGRRPPFGEREGQEFLSTPPSPPDNQETIT